MKRAVLGSVVVLLISACQPPLTRFEVASFKNRPDGEFYSEVFDDGFYCVNAENNWTLLFEIPPTYVDLEPQRAADANENQVAEQPVEAAPTSDNDEEAGLSVIRTYDSEEEDATTEPVLQPRTEPTQQVKLASVPVRMSQLVTIEIFWRAKPGTTFAESSQTNANIVYCLTTGRNSITYEGAGFVSFQESNDKQSIQGRIESAALYPARSTGTPVDLFGRCRVSGTFTAKKDRARSVALMQSLRKRVGPPIGAEITSLED